jgi:hypothetical protein
MVDFCKSCSPFHVCFGCMVKQTWKGLWLSQKSTIREIGIICTCSDHAAHLVYATSHLSFVTFYSYLASWLAMIWACTYYTDFTDGWFLRELYTFSCLFDHTSIQKMCGWTYGQTNMKRATTLAKINHPWNRYNMHMLRSWPTKHILCTQLVICLLSHFIHIWYLGWPWSEHAHIIPISRMVDFCESYSPFHI